MKFSTSICLFGVAGLIASCCSIHIEVEMEAGNTLAGQPGSREPIIYPNPLPVIPRTQEGSLSCWAACAEMVMEFLGGRRIRQCEQASAAFWQRELQCCGEDGVLLHGDCDSQWYPEFEKWGFTYEYRFENALTWEELMTEIDEGRPFAFSWSETDVDSTPGSTSIANSMTHMMVVVGYDEADGDRRTILIDPLFDPVSDPVMLPFAKYNGSGTHPHAEDYFRIQRNVFQ